ncbi:MAG: glycerol-3-phosphate dehydrogenase/oxidase [candidate division KSB1 bacterium]|nr:glycerol-3-phosphate dehydrogenase/oxidase [candidate division KSB1 bacterium]
MRRDLDALTDREFDLLVVGGGIHGVAIAYDAAQRGLRVALIEKGDFGSATSSNSLKIVHGGLRYLQHADLRRMRESIRERRILLRIAPHLVHPLPFLVPTYGHLIKGPEVFAVALALNGLIGADRNRRLPPEQRLPWGEIVPAAEFRKLAPMVDGKNLTGGVIWYDAQMYSSERLLLAFAQSAAEAGAQLANYVEATGYLVRDGRVYGVKAADRLNGQVFDIRARLTVNACGPWYNEVLRRLGIRTEREPLCLSVALNLVSTRKLTHEYAVGFYSHKQYRDQDSVLSRGSRLLFIAPWREVNLVGTAHLPYEGKANGFAIQGRVLFDFLREVQEALPAAGLRVEDIRFYHAGLLPMKPVRGSTDNVTLTKRHQIVDHEKVHRLPGVVSLIGVKYTTARAVAEEVTDLAVRRLGVKTPGAQTAETPLCGGEMESFAEFAQCKLPLLRKYLPEKTAQVLLHCYGTRFQELIRYFEISPYWAEAVGPDLPVVKAQILHAVRREMACKLSDVVFRRTDMAMFGLPNAEALRTAAEIMANELGWNGRRIRQEMEEVQAVFRPLEELAAGR